MTDSQSQKVSNLARIRDNQRRSRARRKEYLQELETKYRECEQAGVAASAEIQAAARRVVDENKRLRQLLRQHGLTDLEIGNLSGDDTGAALDGMLEARRSCNSHAGGGCRTSGSVSSSVDSPVPAPSPLPNYATSPQQQLQPRPPQPQSLYPPQQLSGQQAYSPALDANSHQPAWPPEMYDHASRTAQLGVVDYAQYPSSSNATPAGMNPYDDHPTYGQSPQQNYQISPYIQTGAMAQEQHLGWLQNYPTAEFLKGVPHPHLQPNSSSNPVPTTSSCRSAAETLRVFKPDAGLELEAEMGCRRCVEPGEGCKVESREVFRLVDKYTGGEVAVTDEEHSISHD